MSAPVPGSPRSVFLEASLPGSDRKKSQSRYSFRLTFFDPQPEATGCVMICEVTGGRCPYQVAVERDAQGNLKLHCTCADAIFRAENEGRFCKHARGLLDFGRRLYDLAATIQPADDRKAS